MFSVEKVGNDRLDIAMSGKLDSQTMGLALDELLDKSAEIEHGKMLFDVVDYHLPSLGAIGVELSRIPAMMGFIRKFDRASVLSDQNWVKKISELEGTLMPGLTIKAFSRDQREDAVTWLEYASE
ncbi:STAS/SEC14 domain-containing protein [Photobacterium sp. CCB-ST2H9]|uniref:STAS/SEC14 domain-containing protein n=1 Tax=Photobacterium sp. CCB-ST2H9 TaxID=2912855 RepID=UPI002006A85D|nr:STAS/SEC14 domain-containing protein [Photobacterium sp. CCB-ST2H9]UTM55923.1 STAS/SEC14 domain-containing protein [Photobacterium sp. CCB-ST2H9]